MKPNFFIIGAPKCGTTSLAAWLSEHTNIFVSDPKEISFFNSDIDIHVVRNMNDYMYLFKNANDQHIAVGEASTIYLYSLDAIHNILQFNSNAKFVVMLRNPVDMAVSLHGEMLWNGNECFGDFRTAWLSQESRSTGQGTVGPICDTPALLQYKKVCSTGTQVQRLLQQVDIKSVLFIVMDDFIQNPLKEYKRVLEFLCVPYDGRVGFDKHNSNKRIRSRSLQIFVRKISDLWHLLSIPPLPKAFRNSIRRLNTKKHKNETLPPEFRKELVDTFRSEIALLGNVLNRDLSHWLE